jgi:integrase
MKTPMALYQPFRRRPKKMDLPRIRFHDLRHPIATPGSSRGINVKLVSEMQGHSDITIALRTYGHVLPHLHEAAATEIDLILGYEEGERRHIHGPAGEVEDE